MADRTPPAGTLALSESGFNNVIRFIKQAGLDRVKVLQTVAKDRLKAIGVQPDEDEAVQGCPDGSDQVDTGSIFTWIKNVTRSEPLALDQLLKIEATANSRVLH